MTTAGGQFALSILFTVRYNGVVSCEVACEVAAKIDGGLPMAVGYVYDPIYLEHDTGDHPESSQRLVAILKHLRENELLSQLVAIPARRASVEMIARIHAASLIEDIERMSERGGGHYGSDTVLSGRSYEAALYAAGGTVAAIEAVLARSVKSAFALVRPPGHHATRTQAMGFCLFNNTAIAAAWALDQGLVDRVAIVDIDVHHGNGTQQAFRRDPRVLYLSVHQHPFFPGTGDWRMTSRERNDLVNMPLPAGTGDLGYRLVYDRVIVPALARFEPDVILVSIGYDAHWADPLALMQLSLSGYRFLADGLIAQAERLCDGRIAFVLEGGYDLTVLSHGVATTFAAMLQSPYPDPLGLSPESELGIESLVEQVAAWYGLSSAG